MTGCTSVESLCKYSPWIKTEPHHLAVRGCHLRHFVKPGLPYLSDIISNKLLSNTVPSNCKINVLGNSSLDTSPILPPANVFWGVLFDFLRENSKSWLKDAALWRNGKCLPKNKISGSYHSKVIVVQCYLLYVCMLFQNFINYNFIESPFRCSISFPRVLASQGHCCRNDYCFN